MPSKKKKYNARFPPARIKKIMQTDEEVGKVAAAVPVIISRSLELFIDSLITKASETTISKNAKTLTTSHIKQTIHSEKKFDFLRDLVSSVPDHQAEEDVCSGDGSFPTETKTVRKPRGGRPRKPKDGTAPKRKRRKKEESDSSDEQTEDAEETEEEEEEEEDGNEEEEAGPSTSQQGTAFAASIAPSVPPSIPPSVPPSIPPSVTPSITPSVTPTAQGTIGAAPAGFTVPPPSGLFIQGAAVFNNTGGPLSAVAKPTTISNHGLAEDDDYDV